jgi:transposase
MAEHLTHQQKMTIIRKRYHEQKKHHTIAYEMGCTRQEVGWVLKQFLERGDVLRKKGSGRPSVVDDEVKGVVESTIRRKRHATAAELADAVEDDTGRRVSRRTISRVRYDLGYRPVHVSVKPSLTDAHKAARLAWCRAHLHDDLKAIGFIDESGVAIDYNRRVHWIKRGESRPVRESLPVRVRLNVFAVVWWTGKTELYITRDNFNSAEYIDALNNVLAPELPLGRRRFIQDGVPFHWTHAVVGWFAANRVRLIEDFPAKSPDLNAIEYIWGWMKRVVAGYEPRDADSLETAILEAWENLSQNTVQHFIAHIKTVMAEIIAAQGGNSH